MRVLDRYTLADLARDPRALSRLLFVDEPPRRRRAGPAPMETACAHEQWRHPHRRAARRTAAGAAHGFALWQLGFRPFYLLASSFAALSIALWALQFAGLLAAPTCKGRCGMRTRCCSASRWR